MVPRGRAHPHPAAAGPVRGDADAWASLGLGDPPDDRPLYVGKSESSLADRDLRTHFGDGRTGSSTVRRSFAALLHDALELRGIPRNPSRPERFANYGLSLEHDKQLTTWMRESLLIAVWPTTAGPGLGAVEIAVLRRTQPPLNLTHVSTPWTGMVKVARAVMAAEARRWTATGADGHLPCGCHHNAILGGRSAEHPHTREPK